jgi:hypothetical protein
MIKIRDATIEDFKVLCGRVPPVSVRAIAAVRNGVVECIAGITLEKGITVAFSEMKAPGASKFEIFRTAQKMAKWMEKWHPMVLKTEDSEDTSKFLKMLGFKHIRENNKINIYRL